MDALKRRITDEYERIAGRHDQPSIYAEPAGDPGLVGPGSVSWELHSDLASVGIAGSAAITMEILHPAVMAGVHDFSDYQAQPLKRARATAGYVIATTFGSTDAARRIINRVRRMHERVNGETPSGQPFRAMDPELIGWVHTCIPWGIMRAYERYNRPLTIREKDRYVAEQAVIGRAGGAGDIPETFADLEDYVEAMRPKLAVNAQTQTFFDFLMQPPPDPPLPMPLARLDQALQTRATMSILPQWARRLTGFDRSRLHQALVYEPYLRSTAAMVRWAFGTPVFRQMAEARAAARPVEAAEPVAV